MIKSFPFFLTFLLFSFYSSFAQEGLFHIHTGQKLDSIQVFAAMPDTFDLFASQEPLIVTIESDLKNLAKRKYKDDYQPAILHYQLNDSLLAKMEIRIKSRGEFRKKYCHFPPIKLNFKNSTFLARDIMNLEKMKMVTHCKKGKTYESYILKEYLTYQLFSILSEKSFKARLLKVRYIDTGRDNKSSESFAFVIEDAKKMALRSNAVVMEQEKLSQPHMEDRHMTLVAIFEFMIGNTDWSVTGQHNLKLIKVLELSEPDPYPVPYDFDYSGIVDTDYAIPTDGLNIKSVRDRIFQGYCRTENEYQEILDVFLEKEQAMYDLIEAFPHLDKKDKSEYLSYLESFFVMAKKPQNIYFQLSNTCKQ